MKRRLFMNKKIFGLLLAVPMAIGAFLFSGNYKGDLKPAHAVEALAYADLNVADMQYVRDSGVHTWDTATNGVSITSGWGSVSYRIPASAKVTATYTLNTNSSWVEGCMVNIRMRSSSGDATVDSGYQIHMLGSSAAELQKNGTKLLDLTGPYFAGAPTVVETEFSTIDMSDGSVQVKFVVNGTVLCDYNDATDVCTGNYYSTNTDWVAYTLSGCNDRVKTYWANDLSDPTAPNGSVTFNNDGTLDLANSGASVVQYSTLATGSYGYKMKIRNTNGVGALRSAIGSKTYQVHPYHVIGESSGYYTYWEGQYFNFTRGNVGDPYPALITRSDGPNLVADTEFVIEFIIAGYDDGSVRLTYKIDGAIVLSYFDIKTNENTPCFPHTDADLGGAPGSFVNYFGVTTYYKTATILPMKEATPTTKNLTVDNMGQPTFVGQTGSVDRNGNIDDFSTILAYQNSFKDTYYTFNVNFSSITTGFNMLLNYVGTPDTPWGPGWTDKGYLVRLYPNGMYYLSKGSTYLCEGWSDVVFPIAANTNYTVKVGSYRIDTGVTRVYCSLNGTQVVNFIDYKDDINNEGTFSLSCENATCDISPVGFAPITLDVPSVALLNDPVTLAYENPQGGDTVTYYIDTDLSTATGSIVGNQLTATSSGNIYVYAKVNDFYSESVRIICSKTGVIFDTLPENYVYGSSSPLEVKAVFVDGREITDIEYSIVEGSDVASIEEGTDGKGVITLTGIGVIQVSATLTDSTTAQSSTDTEEGFITIKPTDPTMNFTSIKLGENKNCEAGINAPIPTGDGFKYEVIAGGDCLSVLGTAATGLKVGEATLEVTFAEGKAYEVSRQFTISVVGAEIKTVPADPIIVGNADGYVTAGYTDGTDGTVVKFYLDDKDNDNTLTGKATIDEDTGALHPIAAGTVKVYADVDGIITPKRTLNLNPRIDIGKATAMAVGAERILGYRANCDLPEEEITTTYTLVSGSEHVEDFNPSTGFVRATSIGNFVVRVTVTGETFYGLSIDQEITIENPIVVVTETVQDMIVGHVQEIHATYGNGEIPGVTYSIQLTRGEDLVEVDGMNITAVKPGEVRFIAKANGASGIEQEFVISPVVCTLVAGDMRLNDTQTLEYHLSDTSIVESSVVYSVVSGQDIVAIQDGNKLVSNTKAGEATIKVVVNGTYEDTETIKVDDSLTLLGLTSGAEYEKGTEVELRVRNNTTQTITSVTYEVVSGNATVTTDGLVGKLTITGTGNIVVRVKSGELTSLPITIVGKDPTPAPSPDDSSSEPSSETPSESESSEDKPASSGGLSTGAIVGIAAGSTVVLGGGVAVGIWFFKKKF